jgi:hypothetical protein
MYQLRLAACLSAGSLVWLLSPASAGSLDVTNDLFDGTTTLQSVTVEKPEGAVVAGASPASQKTSTDSEVKTFDATLVGSYFSTYVENNGEAAGGAAARLVSGSHGEVPGTDSRSQSGFRDGVPRVRIMAVTLTLAVASLLLLLFATLRLRRL